MRLVVPAALGLLAVTQSPDDRRISISKRPNFVARSIEQGVGASIARQCFTPRMLT